MRHPEDLDEMLDDESVTRQLPAPVKLTKSFERSKFLRDKEVKFEVPLADGNVESDFHWPFQEMRRLMQRDSRKEFEQNVTNFQLYSSTMKDVSPLGDYGVMKKTIRPGKSGQPVIEGRLVRFHYSSWLEGQDDPFDSSRLRNLVRRVTLNGRGLIHGCYYALLSMEVGETADFIIDSEYAYGAAGLSNWGVPPDAKLRMRIELLDMNDPESPIDAMSEFHQMELPNEEVKKYITEKRAQAKKRFNDGKFSSAFNRYKEVSDLLESRDYRNVVCGYQNDFKIDRHAVYSNMAMCMLKLERFKDACGYCEKADQLLSDDPVVLYRWAKSLFAQGHTQEAWKKAIAARAKVPNNTDLQMLIVDISDRIADEKVKEKLLNQQMFSKPMGEGCAAKPNDTEEATKLNTLVNFAPVKDGFRAHIRQLFNGFANNKRDKELLLNRKIYTLEEMDYIDSAATELGWAMELDEKSDQIKLCK